MTYSKITINTFILLIILTLPLPFLACEEKEELENNMIIERLEPNRATVGEEISIIGNNFSNNVTVKFGTITAEIISVSPTTIKVIVPSIQGSPYVQVFDENRSSNSIQFILIKDIEENRDPRIHDLAPNFGFPIDTVVISGKYFTNNTSIMFGTLSAEILSYSESEMIVVVPNIGSSVSVAATETNYTSNTVNFTLSRNVPLADPFILYHEDTYYAYGTGSDDGIPVYASSDLKKWKRQSNLALHKNNSYADRWFWAPEVYYVNNKFYMYYSANEHICVATSNSPLGPFQQEVKEPMLAEKAIDNSLFIDEDGTPYLFFNSFAGGLHIRVAKLEDDLKTIKPGTIHPCIKESQQWEKVWPTVNEGSFVIKRNDIYYMTYSANSYESQFYGVGCATATDIMGEWTKYAHNPLLQKPGFLVGVGHSSLFYDKEGDLRIVFHAHKDHSNIHPRVMYIGRVGFETVNGVERLFIEENYMTPAL